MSVAYIGMLNVTELELLTHPEYLNSLPVFSGVRVVQSIVICLVFCWRRGGTVFLFKLFSLDFIFQRERPFYHGNLIFLRY